MYFGWSIERRQWTETLDTGRKLGLGRVVSRVVHTSGETMALVLRFVQHRKRPVRKPMPKAPLELGQRPAAADMQVIRSQIT
jgi:hypothetical protein